MAEQNLDEILSLVGGVNELLARIPQGSAIFEKVRNNQISVDQAVTELMTLVKDQGLIPDLMEASKNLNSLVPGVLEATDRPLLMETSTGISQLNPLYEAAIAERASLDGDVPELRSGPFPRDAHPAIPVLTLTTDPVVVGMMLKRASESVRNRLESARDEHAELCDLLREEAEPHALELVEKSLPPIPTGVVGYLAGEVPSMMEISPPSGSELGGLTLYQRREFAFRAIATTQGRVSLSNPIQKIVLEDLLNGGCNVDYGVPSPSSCVSAVWSVHVWNPDDLQDGFNFPVVAAKSLAHDLLNKAKESPLFKNNQLLALEVFPYNGISDRQFGWVARLGYVREKDQ